MKKGFVVQIYLYEQLIIQTRVLKKTDKS